MALPHRTTGSLTPTFVPARPVSLAVKLSYAFALDGRFPIGLREPSRASVTIWEATAPVKLPTRHCPCPRFLCGTKLEFPKRQGGISHCDSILASAKTSKSPTYATQTVQKLSAKLQ
jgi:hypothetical protein